MSDTGIKRGQAITFRVPSDTPDHILKQLQRLKEKERRNFSSTIAGFVLKGAGESLTMDKETLTVPLPKKLSKAQRDWLKHQHSEALLGSIIYQLLADPVRATALLASMNSQSVNIDEALYLQENDEEPGHDAYFENAALPSQESTAFQQDKLEHRENEEEEREFSSDADLDGIDWQQIESAAPDEEEQDTEESVEDLLGGFLSHMNK